MDRHRVLHPVGGIQDTIDIAVGYKDGDVGFEMIPIAKFGRDMNVAYASFADGAQVARFGLWTPEPDIEMTRVVMECGFAYRMAFAKDVGIAPVWGVVDVLGNILHHIRDDVLPPFVAFYPTAA